MSRAILAVFVVLFSVSVATAQDPTITWDVGSPTATPGPRISASGKYTIPANAGNVTWTLNKIVVEYRLNGTQTWTATNATVDTVNKAWSYQTITPLPAGLYQVRARIETTKVTTNPGPPITVTSEGKNAETDVKNVTL